MRSIKIDRIYEYELLALKILQENGGRLRSREIIKLLEQRLELNAHERSLYNSGQPRWVTKFRFYSIGLVKANIISKEDGFWKLINEPKVEIESLTKEELREISETAYDEWERTRDSESENKEEVLWPESVVEDKITLNVEPAIISFDDLLKGVDNSFIQVPPFQREFVWSARDISLLLDSIYNGYPIGSFIFWKTARQLPYHRSIGGIALKEVRPGTIIDYVIDGQQRITSLYAAVRGAEIEAEKITFYFNLNGQKFQYKRVGEELAPDEITPLIPLDMLFVQSAPEYMRYISKYPDHLQDTLHNLYHRFKMYKFSVIYVNEEDETINDDQSEGIKRIVDMFSRINDTGKKLSLVAKMVARCWGEGFDISKKLEAFYTKYPEVEEIREDTILQAASVILNHRRCTSSAIINSTDIDELENRWEEIIESFILALEFVRNKIKIKNLRYLPFDSLLVPIAYFHYKQRNPSQVQLDQLEKWFWKASLSNRFGSSTPSNIEEDCGYFDKIIQGEHIDFPYPIDWESFKSRLLEQNYSLRNAFCKTILALYSYKNPKSFKDNRDIDLKGSLSGYYKHHLHHIFPRKFLEKQDSMDYQKADSVVNIAFSPAITNLEMSDTAPSEYFNQFEGENPGLQDNLNSHFIGNFGEFGINEDDFDKFLDRRATEIEHAFKDLLGLRSYAEQQFEIEPTKSVDLIEAKLRNLILESLTDEYGPDFWEDSIPVDIRIAVKKKCNDHLRSHAYDQTRLENPEVKMSYLDIMDYAKIISTNWNLFEEYFKSRGETDRHFLALKNYRNPIKHIRDLNPVVKRNGEAAVLWFESLLMKN